jgi:hypothetical protein
MKLIYENVSMVLVGLIVLYFLLICGTNNEFNVGDKSDALLYVENNNEPNPFVLYGMVQKITTDEEKQKKALTLATDQKRDELIEFLKTI